MKVRQVIVTVESILALLKDYCGEEEIPEDAKVVGFKYKPTELGRFAIVIESPRLKYGVKPIEVRVDNKRIYGVGR